jgi:hypothetical protein
MALAMVCFVSGVGSCCCCRDLGGLVAAGRPARGGAAPSASLLSGSGERGSTPPCDSGLESENIAFAWFGVRGSYLYLPLPRTCSRLVHAQSPIVPHSA